MGKWRYESQIFTNQSVDRRGHISPVSFYPVFCKEHSSKFSKRRKLTSAIIDSFSNLFVVFFSFSFLFSFLVVVVVASVRVWEGGRLPNSLSPLMTFLWELRQDNFKVLGNTF